MDTGGVFSKPFISAYCVPGPSLITMKHTSGFAHGDRLDKVLRSHVELSFVLHRAEHAEAVLMGRHVHISVLKVRHAVLRAQNQNRKQMKSSPF